LRLSDVVEVFRMVATAARLPRAPRHCLGVIDCRGRLLPLFDLGARLGITPPRSEGQLVDGHVVLTADAVGQVCFAVDELRELVESSPEPLAQADRFVLGAVRCSDGRLAPLLDRAALFTVRMRQQLTSALEALRGSEGKQP
jgi:chemotaxis signal transduction protein